MFSIPCVIFAGGKSSRMGEDKALLPFADFNTLTEFQYSRLTKLFKNVYISCKDKNKFSFNANYIEDKKVETVFAPTLAFVSIFEALHTESFFTISVDAPFIDETIIHALIKADQTHHDATIAKTEDGVQALIGIYHHSLLKDFKQMIQEDRHKLTQLLNQSKTRYVNFKNDNSFLNLNYPQEYKKALHLISS